MARIERITMQGFKSFADRVSIPFPHGFTAICGPNGSGKSNISDALMFSLGISTAKHIRAEKLANLIFHGTKKRGNAKYCLVSLYIDNRDKKLPLEEEIKITRKVNDKGLTIFRLNGKVVTRNKILDILNTINLSPYGHNIIMQGDVTRIIEMSDVERREMIDQVSGIAEFDDKSHKAGFELEKVNKHINEMQIISDEKEKLLKKLETERENAIKLDKLNKELSKIRASLANLQKADLEEGFEKFDSEIAEQNKELEELNKVFNDKANELDEKRKMSKSMVDNIIKKSRDLELNRKINSLNMEILRKADRIEINETEIKKMQLDEVAKVVINNKGVLGTFSQIIEMPEKYAVAIKTAAGRHMNDIIVENTEVALECVEMLKKNRAGRARFLPLDRMKSRKIELKNPEETNKLILDFAVNAVKYDPKYSGVVNYVLGNVLLSENLQVAKHIRENAKIATLDGDIMEPAGAIIGGFHKTGSREIALMKENERLRAEMEKLGEELETLKAQEQAETKDVDQLNKERSEIEKSLEHMQDEVDKLYEKRMAIQSKINKINIEKARKEADIKNMRLELEKYKDVSELYSETPGKLREMLSRALSEVQSLGLVNMKASEEFQTITIEFEELKKRLDKMIGERDAIVNTIAEIEKRKFEKFDETLKVINANFAKIYKDMMNGEGYLRLAVEGDMNSGLIIEANPGSKKIINMDAMSGGEKTMTALGFLFAIQQYHASPFYVLDEIDAALDKVNTKKVADFIKKYCEETQFIVVSHNDIMIKEADNVFGVAMEDAVSRVFSIRMPGIEGKEVKEDLSISDDNEEEEDWGKAEKDGKYNYGSLLEEKPSDENEKME